MGYLVAGIGAGLVSALLFAVVITGSPLAFLLSYLAPLPVFVAALGWKHRAGLVAALAGGLVLALALRFPAGLAFAIGIALPAWGMAYLSLLGRQDERGEMEWYPLGRLMMWIAGTAALVTLAGAMAIVGDYDTYRAGMQRSIEAVLSGRVPGFPAPRLPAGVGPADMASMLATWAPYVAGASFVPMITANLWIAAKAVHASGRLPRPWPYIPALSLPREALGVGALALLLAFAPGFFGFFGMAILGALSAAFLLNGLACIHALTAGKGWRVGALIGLYGGLLVAGTLLAPLIAVFGFVDCLLGLRGRAGATPPATT
jgi:hypothetical protein